MNSNPVLQLCEGKGSNELIDVNDVATAMKISTGQIFHIADSGNFPTPIKTQSGRHGIEVGQLRDHYDIKLPETPKARTIGQGAGTTTIRQF